MTFGLKPLWAPYVLVFIIIVNVLINVLLKKYIYILLDRLTSNCKTENKKHSLTNYNKREMYIYI